MERAQKHNSYRKLFAASLITTILVLITVISADPIISLFKMSVLNKRNEPAPLTGGQIVSNVESLPQATPVSATTLTVRQPAARIQNNALFVTPALQSFIKRVSNDDPDEVRGVYIAGVLALLVIQQPEEDPAYVSPELGVVTQFRSAAQQGVIGLLAHNYLSGSLFYSLKQGQEVNLVFGDGSLRRYQVETISTFQKLDPSGLHSEMIDLNTGEKLTTAQIFDRFYRGDDHITFQTCLERNGISNWGLTFTVATPIQ